MSWLTVNEVTANAITVLKDATEEERNYMRTWVVSCLRNLGPDLTWYKVCKIEVKEKSIKKPSDYTSSVGISLFDSTDTELNYVFHSGSKRIHTDRFSVNDTTDQLVGRLDLSEDAYYFHLGGTLASSVDYAMLRYWAFPTDRDGLPLIKEEDLEVYVNFCRWKWSQRKNDNRSEIQQNYEFWKEERNRVHGNNKMPNIPEADKILRSWVTLIAAPQRPEF